MSTEYWINVRNVDNRLVIFFDGETIWDSGIIHDDPAINKFIEITHLLGEEPGCTHELIFEGFNNNYTPTVQDPDEELNPWHFNYRIFKRLKDLSGAIISEQNIVEPYDQRHLSNPRMRAISNSYRIVRKNDEFKVVANSISQQFQD